MQIVAGLVLLFETYAALGCLFALAFAWWWVERIDHAARGGTLGFRLLILPGAAALWPLFLYRLVRSTTPSTPARSEKTP